MGKEGSASVDERNLSEMCCHRKNKKKKKGKEELHLISVQHHHSPTFLFLPFFLSSAAFNFRRYYSRAA